MNTIKQQYTTNPFTLLPTSELEEELERRNGIFYRGIYKHKKDCDCGMVNPITEWAGGSNLIIIGYECPKCKMITKIRSVQ
jgi:hypothetical protein